MLHPLWQCVRAKKPDIRHTNTTYPARTQALQSTSQPQAPRCEALDMSQEVIEVDDCMSEAEEDIDDSDSAFEDVRGDFDGGVEDDKSNDEAGEGAASAKSGGSAEGGGSTEGGGSAVGGGSAGGARGSPMPSQAFVKRAKRDHESDVWKYFQPVEGDTSVAVCLLCKKTLKTGGGTSNQRAQICRTHPKEAIADGLVENKRTTQASLDGHLVFAPGYLKQAVK